MSSSAIAGLALCTLLFAGPALAQGTSGTTGTPPKAAEPPAQPAQATPPAEPKSAVEPKPAVSRPGGVARTIVGEVVDPACYLVNGAHGEGHKECATACAKAGQTLAILERKTNKLYLLVSDHPGDDPNKSLMDYIAQTVTIKGKVFSRGGVTGLMVVTVEPGAAKAN